MTGTTADDDERRRNSVVGADDRFVESEVGGFHARSLDPLRRSGDAHLSRDYP